MKPYQAIAAILLLVGCQYKIRINNDMYQDLQKLGKHPTWGEMYRWKNGALDVDTLNQKVFEITAQELRNRVRTNQLTWVVLGFDFCDACLKTLPAVDQLAGTLADRKGFEFLYIHNRYSLPLGFRAFTRQRNFQKNYYIIKNEVYGSELHAKAERFVAELMDGRAMGQKKASVCSHLVLDGQGRVVYHDFSGQANLDRLRQFIEAGLAGEVPVSKAGGY